MEQTGTVTILFVALAAFLAFVLYKRSVAAQAALATPTVTGAAGALDSASRRVSNVIRKIPYVGNTVDDALSKPITNVTEGHVGDTLKSIVTGGITDWWPS
jgi:hypothetical protein